MKTEFRQSLMVQKSQSSDRASVGVDLEIPSRKNLLNIKVEERVSITVRIKCPNHQRFAGIGQHQRRYWRSLANNAKILQLKKFWSIVVLVQDVNNHVASGRYRGLKMR